MELSERKRKILAAVVELYIKTGEPVGSKALCELPELSVSSATIRNEMSELAEMGLLEQPHTSAGRIPSQEGYRYYIDHLMGRHELTADQRRRMDSLFTLNPGDPEKVLGQAGEVLADLTNCAAVSTTPADAQASIKRVELVPVSSSTAMIVLLTTSGILKSGLCRTMVPIDERFRTSFANIAEQHFIGHPVSELSLPQIQTLAASLGEHALTMSPALITLAQLAREAAQAEILLDGQTNLLSYDGRGTEVREALEFLRDTGPLGQLIGSGGDRMQVFIGSENVFRQLRHFSMILAPYKLAGRTGGTIGIIGPTRMDYASLIPHIEYLSAIVGKLLSEALGGDDSAIL